MRLRYLACLASALCAPAAWGQIIIPPGLEPGQIQRELRQLRVPRAVPDQVLPPAPEQLAPAQASELTFVLRNVDIEGASVYSAAKLAKAFEPLLGQTVSVAQVFRLANEQTARYRRDGYLLSQVLVPAQNIVDGNVQLIAVEGYIDDVQFRGDVPANNRLLAAYAAHIKRAKPLTAAVLERYLLLMNDLGQTSARGTLVPSVRAQGAADLIVDFVRDRTHLSLATHTRGSRSLGPARINLELGGIGALAAWDAVSLTAGSTTDDELRHAGIAYGAPLGKRGVRWNLGATGVQSKPGPAANLVGAALETESIAGILELSGALVRSRTRNLYSRLSLTSFDGQSEFSRVPLSEDRLRVARLGFAFDYADRWRGINLLDVEYSKGLDALGARIAGTADAPLSRANGRADFSKASLYAARLQSLGGAWSGLLAISSQEAFDTLLAPELFAFGGEPFGRGYDAAELVGDSGEAAKVELRYAGAMPQLGVGTYSLYGFYDWGRVRRRDAVNEPEREDASAAGFGIRLTGSRGRWQAFAELANPLDRDVAAEGNRDVRVFAGFQLNL
ncbi:MAG: ShlB/FhaC/HecB family hemolysin secretion/activation protein [Gammaproteobacteria bacterium]